MLYTSMHLPAKFEKYRPLDFKIIYLVPFFAWTLYNYMLYDLWWHQRYPGNISVTQSLSTSLSALLLGLYLDACRAFVSRKIVINYRKLRVIQLRLMAKLFCSYLISGWVWSIRELGRDNFIRREVVSRTFCWISGAKIGYL